jgi:hypothetical protein
VESPGDCCAEACAERAAQICGVQAHAALHRDLSAENVIAVRAARAGS